MGREREEHHFARWFLFSSAYESWHGLTGWFADEDREMSPAAARPDDPPQPPDSAARSRR